MLYAFIKAAISGILIAAASEIAKRSPAIGALVVSLPLISVMSMIWLWHDTGDTERIAQQAEATFWLVLPTLPMFLLFPILLRGGMHFYIALGLSCLLTITLYALMVWTMKRFGIEF